jgi:hypothetical protein
VAQRQTGRLAPRIRLLVARVLGRLGPRNRMREFAGFNGLLQQEPTLGFISAPSAGANVRRGRWLHMQIQNGHCVFKTAKKLAPRTLTRRKAADAGGSGIVELGS